MPKCKKKLTLFLSICAPAITGISAFGQSTTYSGAANDHLWGTSANWSNGLPGTFAKAIFNNSASGAVNLGDVTRTIDTLEFDNSIGFAGNPNYTLSSGTLTLKNLTVTGYLAPGNRITANVSAAAKLTADLRTSATTYIDGTLATPFLNLINSQFGFAQGTLQLSNSSNQISTISVGDSTQLVATAPGALGAGEVDISTNGTLSVFANTGQSNYGNNIHAFLGGNISSTITPGQSAPANAKFGALTMDPDSDVSLYALGASLSFTSTTLDGDSVINVIASNGNVADLGAVHEQSAHSTLISNGSGVLRISGASNYTGGTMANIGYIDATADGSLGHGLVQITADGAVRLAHQSAANFNALDITAYAAIGGDLTGAHYSGASRNVTAAPNTIFFSMTPGTAPVRGVDVNSAQYLAGITDNAQTMVVGDNPTSIYYGVAFGMYSPAGTFGGAISESAPGQGIGIYTTTTLVQYIGGATLNSISGPAGPGGVNFTGAGEVRLVAPTLGTASVYNVTGGVGTVTDSNIVMSLYGANTLATGRTINISNGRLVTGDGRSLAVGSTINVLDTGTYELDDYNTAGVSASPMHGTINVNLGGALYVATSTANPAGGANFNFSPGSLLILGAPADTGTPTWISPNADIVASTDGAFTGSGIVLGNGRRLTTPDFNITLFGGTGISAAPGATRVLLTASTDTTLQIEDPVNLPGVDLQINDANPFNGIRGSTSRTIVGQDGFVILSGGVVAHSITVAAGNLQISNLTAPSLANNANLTLGGTSNIAAITGTGSTTADFNAIVTADSIHQSDLTINDGATVTIRSNGHAAGAAAPTVNVLNSLFTSDTAKLDINDGDLIIHYSGSSPLGDIASYLASAYNHGSWDGVGIASSAAHSHPNHALGYIDNADIGYTMFDNEPVDADSILVKYTFTGDNTLDGKVDLGNDFSLFLIGYLTPGATGWDLGDYNYDGVVDNADFRMFIDGYAAQGNSLGQLDQVIEFSPLLSVSQKASLLSVVPEPSSVLALTAATGLLSLARRRRRY